jgi:hypothetical protein
MSHRGSTPVWPVDGPLEVVETRDAWLVVRTGDPEDWLAAFEKTGGPAAREWAEAMARTYNQRLRHGVPEAGTRTDRGRAFPAAARADPGPAFPAAVRAGPGPASAAEPHGTAR